MTIEVRAEVTIPASPERVFALAAADAANLARFFTGNKPLIPGIVEASVEGPMREGALRAVKLSDGSKITERVTAWELNRRHGYDMAEMNALQRFLCTNMVSDWRFEPDGAGTRIVWTYAILAKPGRGWIARIVARSFQKAMATCLDNVATALKN